MSDSGMRAKLRDPLWFHKLTPTQRWWVRSQAAKGVVNPRLTK